jgi:hypothetical protein
VRLRDGDRSRSHDAVIRVYDEAGNVIETHEPRAISKSGKRFVRINVTHMIERLFGLPGEITGATQRRLK